jgi:hypothetical protein
MSPLTQLIKRETKVCGMFKLVTNDHNLTITEFIEVSHWLTNEFWPHYV